MNDMNEKLRFQHHMSAISIVLNILNLENLIYVKCFYAVILNLDSIEYKIYRYFL